MRVRVSPIPPPQSPMEGHRKTDTGTAKSGAREPVSYEHPWATFTGNAVRGGVSSALRMHRASSRKGGAGKRVSQTGSLRAHCGCTTRFARFRLRRSVALTVLRFAPYGFESWLSTTALRSVQFESTPAWGTTLRGHRPTVGPQPSTLPMRFQKLADMSALRADSLTRSAVCKTAREGLIPSRLSAPLAQRKGNRLLSDPIQVRFLGGALLSPSSSGPGSRSLEPRARVRIPPGTPLISLSRWIPSTGLRSRSSRFDSWQGGYGSPFRWMADASVRSSPSRFDSERGLHLSIAALQHMRDRPRATGEMAALRRTSLGQLDPCMDRGGVP